MASVDYMKVKTRAHLYGLIDHDAMETRLVKKHRNKHIDITKTATENWQTWDAETARERFRERIDELDGTTNTNKRKDRVEAFALEVKPPPGIPLDLQKPWLWDVYELIEGRVGKPNVIGGYIHGDELHEYRDARTGLVRMSRKELHMLVVPEIAGKLNGRKFSSPAAMKAMNKAIDKMTQAKYGVPFLTGEDPADPSIPYGTSTADLKMESALVQAVLDEHNGLMAQERAASRLAVQMEQHEANELREEVSGLKELAGTILTDAMEQASEITADARRDARATRREADDYAYKARRTANRHAVDITNEAEADAQEIREAAELDAQATRLQAERDAQVMREQVAAMRRERDEAQADRDAAHQDAQEWAVKTYKLKQGYDKLKTARAATRAALQGDLEAWAGLTPEPSSKALLGVLGAAVEASRVKRPPLSPGVGGAYERMMAMVRRSDAQDAAGRDGPELG